MAFFFFLLTIPYYDLIFSISTTKCTNPISVLVGFCFSLCYSGIIFGLTSIIKSRKIRNTVLIVILSLVPIVYYAEFLVYRSFKVFYDINTCMNGAGGALTGFMSDILRLIFNFDGISRLLLFMLPLVIYLVFFKKQILETFASTPEYFEYFGIAIAAFLIAVFGVFRSEPHKMMYASEYSFQTVVENLGFSTGLRLDIKNIIFKKDEELSFVNAEEFGEDKVSPTPRPTSSPQKDASFCLYPFLSLN